MNRHVALRAPALWLVWAAAAVAPAADDLLQVLPDNTLGFVVVNRMAETSAKAKEIGDRLRLPLADPLALSKARAGITTGLDEQGSAAIVLVPAISDDAELAVILLLPVSDYRKFITQLRPDDASAPIAQVTLWDTKMLARNVGHYALFVEPAHRVLLEHAAGAKRVVADELAQWRIWLAEKDVAGVVTSAGIQLIAKLAKQHAVETLASGVNLGEFEWVISNLSPEFRASAEQEVRSLALGVNWDRRGALRAVGRCAFWPNGTAATLCRAIEPGTRNALAGLPGGPFALAATIVVPEAVRGWLADGMVKAQKALTRTGRLKKREQEIEKLAGLSRTLAGRMGECSLLLQAEKHGESLLSQLFVRQQVDDAKAFLDDFAKCLEGYNAIAKKSANALPAVQVKRTEIEKRPALEAAVDCAKLFGDDDPFGIFAEIEGKVVGPEGKLTADFVAADPQHVAAGCINQKLLRSALLLAEKPEAGLAGDKDVAKLTAMLPERALLTVVMQPDGINSLLRGLGALIAVFPATAPLGFAITTNAADLEAHLVLSPELLRTAHAYSSGTLNQ